MQPFLNQYHYAGLGPIQMATNALCVAGMYRKKQAFGGTSLGQEQVSRGYEDKQMKSRAMVCPVVPIGLQRLT